MNYAIILAGGTGQRMKQSGMPKQFLNVYGKPIIVYTLETFQNTPSVDEIIIPCNVDWLEHLESLVKEYHLTKVKSIVVGGKDRVGSVWAGLREIQPKLQKEDVVIIHDGVRPLVAQEVIEENITVAKEKGNAMTVRSNIETVVVTETKDAQWEDFKNRDHTYTLTSPQSFRALELINNLELAERLEAETGMPILDASLAYAKLGKKVYIVIDKGNNLKITTPEDYYYLKSYLELQESKHILGV